MTTPSGGARHAAPDGRDRDRDRRSGWSLPVGRVLGIPVRVHASFLVLVVLVVATAGDVPGGAPAALAWLVLLFGCVLLHELAHSAVARRRGVEVDEILLLPIGGISRMSHLPSSARDELAIAAAGPLSSFALAVLAGVAAAATGAALLPPALAVGPLAARLFWVNLTIGAFNLLPAFPLDGGRVLRALLQRRMGLEAATHRAARLGRIVAVTLVVVGVLVNLWLVVIGVFVYLGGAAEEAATTLHARLEGRRVADLMRAARVVPLGPRPGAATALDPEEPVTDEVVDRLQHAPHHLLPVERDGRLVGSLSLDDVVHLLQERPTPVGPGATAPLPPPPPPPTTAHQIWRHRHGR